MRSNNKLTEVNIDRKKIGMLVIPCATIGLTLPASRQDISESDFRRRVVEETSGSRRSLCRSQQSLVGLVYSVDLPPNTSPPNTVNIL